MARLTNRNPEKYNKITHLIIDEVHERNKDTDLILVAVKDELRTNKNLKVILMSATVDCNKFSQYFNQCIVINIPGHTFEVEIYHLREILATMQYQIPDIDQAGGHDQLSAYMQAREKEIDHDLLVHVIGFIHLHTPKDEAILVFLPGYREIMDQNDLINDRFETSHWTDYKLILLHSNMEDANVFDRLPDGIRKIILATNIAETSITIDDVVHVIDVGILKENNYMPNFGSMCLAPIKISKACAKQRTGRAGRTRRGFCYRLYSDEQYASMVEHQTPEIKRIPLTDMSLRAKMLAPDQEITEFLMQAIDPPPIVNLRQSIQLLKDIGALNSNEDVTSVGCQLANMPVDCQLGKMVLCAIVLKCLDPILTIVSALSMREPFLMANDVESRKKVNKDRRKFAYDALSDHRMLLDIYDGWSSSENRRRFCSDNSISNANMIQIERTRTFLERHVLQHRTKTDLNLNSLKWDVAKACIVAGLNRELFLILNFLLFKSNNFFVYI